MPELLFRTIQKDTFPRITKNNTIKKAVMQDVFAIDFLSDSSLSPTNPKKTGVFAIGFIIAKNPVKTVKEKVKILVTMLNLFKKGYYYI